MRSLKVKGGKPLIGTVKPSGAKNSANKLIAASIFSNDDIILENVPRIGYIEWDLKLVESIGVKYEWLSKNRLKLNCSNINSFELPYSLGSKTATSVLLGGPLLFRFGKAILPKPKTSSGDERPINRLIDTWKTLGVEVVEDERYVVLKAGEMQGTSVKFDIDTHIGTDNAILSTAALKGESLIVNAAQYYEIEDLIKFINLIGGNVKRDSKQIKVNGVNVFDGGSFGVTSDAEEVANYMIGALVTNGNVVIKNVQREPLLSLANLLSKVGSKYEFSKNELRVWSVGTEVLEPVTISTSPAPGLLSDWQPLLAVLLTQVKGTSYINETVYVNRFDYIWDLNRMGADIDLMQPSQAGLPLQISDDSYDIQKQGEPNTVLRIKGGSRLKGEHVTMANYRSGASLLIAALTAEGESTISGFEKLEYLFEDVFHKFSNLGANIEIVED